MRPDHSTPIRLVDYKPPNHLVEQVALDIHLHPTQTEVAAQLLVRPNPAAGGERRFVLNRDGILPDRVMIDGRPLAASEMVVEDGLLIVPDAPDRPFAFETFTLIDPKANTALSGLYLSNGIFCTQCEAEGFRRITPFPDRPDVLARYKTRIEAPKADARFLLSNGNRIGGGDLPGRRHFAVWDDPWPKPSYLFALVGGNLALVSDSFVTRSGREVQLEIYVEEGKEDRCAWAMESLKRSMRWDEEAFGREYDLDVFMIVAVSDFNMGAMENKGLNIFNDKYILALPDTATDSDFVNIEAIIAHEYFHNWTGNRITCRDWFQLCLKEGLTVFRDQEFTSDVRSRAVKRIADVRLLRNQQFVEDAGPLAHPVRPDTYHEINNFYTATVYEKGAEVIRMLKVLLGPDDFQRGMDLYFERHDGDAATVEQFVACFSEVSRVDLRPFMRWYTQAGTPEVVAEGQYDAAARAYALTLRQTVPPTPAQPHKLPMVIPVTVGFIGADGKDLDLITEAGPLPRGLVVLEDSETRVVFRNIHERPVPSLLRGFSAPVRLTVPVTDADLLFQLAHDSDAFNRWQAGQTLTMRHLMAACGALPAWRAPAPDAIADAMRSVLDDAALEPAFVALALSPPSETDIARELARNVDPDVVFQARATLRRTLAAALEDRLAARYDALSGGGPYVPDAASVGRRALKNALLDLMCSTGTPAAVARAQAQFEAADNMTDRLGALTAMGQVPGVAREHLFAAFYERYAGDPLVVDKWFAAQASLPEPETLNRVIALTGHAAFAFSNPNRVRALIGTFAAGNPTQFNRLDGAGFAFLADIVLQLDPRNPQVAARLLAAFRSWRALEPKRRTLAEQALKRVSDTPDISADVADIARRSLA